MSDSAIQEERKLLQEIASGSEHAFRKLYMQYHQQLGAYIYKLSNSLEMTQEIVQDVFLKIWTNRQALQEVKSFKAYLFVISKNYALNALKKTLRERRLQEKYDFDEYYKAIEGSEELNTLTYYQLIDDAIDKLPPRQKEVFIMSRHNKLKYSQIAEKMNLSTETVKKYLQLATISIVSYVREHTREELTLLIYFFYFFYFPIPPF